MAIISYYHGRNEILAALITAVNSMLADFSLSQTWQVASLNQPTIQALQNRTVYVDIISRRRYGTQGTKPILVNGAYQDATVWYEEILVQVGGFLQRDPNTDGVSTLTSTDVIEYLQGCINANIDFGTVTTSASAHGVPRKSYFEKDWLEVIRSTDLRELDYETDSGLKEKFPQFDFTIVVSQKILKNTGAFDSIEVETERI